MNDDRQAEIEHAVKLARGLMQDDPDTFHAGYTLDNAVLAVEAVYGIPAHTVRLRIQAEDDRRDAATEIVDMFIGAIDMEAAIDALLAHSSPWLEGNEDGSNRDVPPFDNDPRTDAQIKQEVYDRDDDWLGEDEW